LAIYIVTLITKNIILLNSDALYCWLTQPVTVTPDAFYASSEVLTSFG